MTISVVLADDHDIVLEGLRSVLSRESGYLILGEARTGEAAMSLTLEHNPDILVLDITMPDLDGIEVAWSLTKKPDFRTKILALSMHSEREFVQEMFAAGASGYLLKDTVLRELPHAIDTVLKGHRYMSDELVDVVLQDTSAETETTSPLDVLTDREREIYELVITGITTKEIAYQLGISPRTVDVHRAQIAKKLGADSMLDLVRLAIKEGLVDL
jgi:DNA-binding NarL/FixJ family response regulator